MRKGLDCAMTVKFGDWGAPGAVEVYCLSPKGVTLNGRPLGDAVDYKFNAISNRLSIPFAGVAAISISGPQSLFAR